MNNEQRADLGLVAIVEAATRTGVLGREPVETCIIDVLTYVAHYCTRLGLNPAETFLARLESYVGDFEDGPGAELLEPGAFFKTLEELDEWRTA
jgi:hypothetical protein